jgi:hypothetical protein
MPRAKRHFVPGGRGTTWVVSGNRMLLAKIAARKMATAVSIRVKPTVFHLVSIHTQRTATAICRKTLHCHTRAHRQGILT